VNIGFFLTFFSPFFFFCFLCKVFNKAFFSPLSTRLLCLVVAIPLVGERKEKSEFTHKRGGGTALLHTSVAAGLKFDRVSVEFELELSNRNDILIRDNLLQTTPK